MEESLFLTSQNKYLDRLLAPFKYKLNTNKPVLIRGTKNGIGRI